MSEYTKIFQPLIDLFDQSQVNTILLAWLPIKFGAYMTGIMAVDMFITNVIASGISTFVLALYKFICSRILGNQCKNDDIVGSSITVQIEYYSKGNFDDSSATVI